MYDFEFEKKLLSKDDFKDLMYDEIMLNHSDEVAFKYIKDGAPEKMKLIIIKKLVPFFNEIY